MATPFLAEIRVFGCNFAPTGFALCNGQLLAISQNTALFSLLGTTYGGDGRSTFGLPNIQGQATMHWGQGSGLTSRSLGETGGSPTVSLLTNQMPAHNHLPSGLPQATKSTPNGNVWGNPGNRKPAPVLYATAIGTQQVMNNAAIQNSGSSLPHNNLMPYQTLTYCIAMQGIFPARS